VPRRIRACLEELESRLAPAYFAVNANLEVSRLDALGGTLGEARDASPPPGHAVVFFESNVAHYQVLQQGLNAGVDAVLLDSGGDGVREMAAFLAGRDDLASIGVIAHGMPGAVRMGTATLDSEQLGLYSRELATWGSALGSRGELDLWSCAVAGGAGASLIRGLHAATGAGVAAADHIIGAEGLGGTWQLDVRTAGARGGIPFATAALGDFDELLGTWSAAASMATPRVDHTATLLVNGKVLIVGGHNNTIGDLSSAALYNPVNNTWSSAGSMASTRQSGYTATLLGNGKVLVVGGFDISLGAVLSSAELYDSVNNTWSSARSMATPRRYFTATLLNNGKVLVAGGYDSSGHTFSSAELYDPVNNTWSSASSMATPRRFHTATLLSNGKVLVTGGDNGTGDPPLSSAELYDPTSNTWSSAGSMATARYGQTATLLDSGKVLVTGGSGAGGFLSSVELYDPASNTWSSAGSMAAGRLGHTATLLGNGKVLVAGGRNLTADTLSSAELYNPDTNTWSATGSMAAARRADTATLLPNNGKVLVAGGVGINVTYLSSAELYDPTGASASQSTISVVPASIPLGSTAAITLTARDDAGNPVTSGGLSFSFGLGAGTGSGTFSNLLPAAPPMNRFHSSRL
jgi:N-acetylneuraminic acid mutarotase